MATPWHQVLCPVLLASVLAETRVVCIHSAAHIAGEVSFGSLGLAKLLLRLFDKFAHLL